MKKLFGFVLLALLLAGPVFAADPATRPFAPVQAGLADSAPEMARWADDHLLIQLTREAFADAQLVDEDGKADGAILRTGLKSLDEALFDVQFEKLTRALWQPARKADAEAFGLDRWYQVDLGGSLDAAAARERLLEDPNLEQVTLDYIAFPHAVPNDTYYPANWGHNNTAQLRSGVYHNGSYVGTPGFDSNAQAAWDESQGYGDAGVVIAIIDTGVDPTHPDLVQVAGYDFGDNDSDPTDDSAAAGHGTACAGIAAGVANNALGVTGIAGGCSIMPLKVANTAGAMYMSRVANALIYAADNGADVASMSLGSYITSDPVTDNAAAYAYSQGLTMTASTGNENTTQIGYPAYNTFVIGVGAASPCGDRKRSSSSEAQVNPGVNTDPNGTTCDGEYYWGSSYGSTVQDHQGAVDVLAPTILPATDIQGTAGYSYNDYSSYFNGTSCASPYAAGVCALIISRYPSFSAAQVRAQLVGTAQDIVNVESVEGWDRYSGYGMVDAASAVGGVVEPPILAAFEADQTDGCAPFTVNFTDLTTGSVTNWSWDFGDGLASIQQNPSHTYNDVGTYTVSLTASGPEGSSQEIKNAYITVGTVPTADFTIPAAAPMVINAGDNVTFTDASTGAPVSWAWDFGDGGTSSEQSPTYSWSSGGFFTVTLTVQNGCGSDTFSIVNAVYVMGGVSAPTADFGLEPASGCAPLEVAFTDLSTGSPTSWAWDFGDGGASTDQNPSHTYTAAGTYAVSLTATNAGGSDELVVAGAVTVGGAPTAAFAISDTAGLGPLDVTFTDESTGGATAWAWDFGDGATSTEQSPTHTYETKGYFTVRLIASNGCDADTLSVVDAVHIVGVSGAGDGVPVAFGLGRNYPNPFNPSTTLVFSLEKSGHALLEVFDVSGRLVARLVDADRTAGRHEVTWRPEDLASGVYFARLRSGMEVDTQRVTLLK